MTTHKLFLLLFLFGSLLTEVWAQEERGSGINKTAPKTAVGTTRALIVGVSQYQHINSLRFAGDDALAFYNYLLSPAGGSVPQANIELLLNEKATLVQVDLAMGKLLNSVKPNDRVFIYFSGHGDQESKTIAQRGFLLTHDTFSSNYNSTAFAVLYLQDYIATLATKNQAQIFLFLDACRSGKLAGSEIGGVQLAGQQLLKQVANEVKFMACQANELSLEGYQWGGGRGVFSYHLIRGMQGLADADGDKTITLRELERYLEDRVTAEAAPNRQNPLLLAADKSLPLVKVDPATLAAVRQNLPPPAFAAVQGKGFVETILDSAPDDVQKTYADFHEAIAQKQLLDSPNSADGYYEKLLATPSIGELHPFIKREFAAALLEESTKTFGQLLANKNLPAVSTGYRKNIRYLEKAAQILGKSHYFYPNLRAQTFYYKGLLTESANRDEALLNYRQAITADSTFAPAYNDAGRLLFLKQSFREAQEIFEKGLQLAPKWSYLHLNYGMVLVAQKKWTEAETAYKEAIELQPDNAIAFKNYGNLLAGQNKGSDAETAYKKAIELNPNDPETYNNYGMLLNAQKRYSEAETEYKKAIELQPDNAQVYSNYGIVLAIQNRQAEAEFVFRKSIELNPKDAQAHFNYGILLATQNRLAEAEIAYKKAIELAPNDAIAYNSYGVLLAAQNRLAEAEQAYKKYVELSPNNAIVYGNYGNLLARQGRQREAETAYKRSIELNPNDANVHKSYAILLKNLNRPAEAETSYKRAIQLKTDDAEVYKNYGMLLNARNRPEEAEANFKKAIELNPDDPFVYNSYGMLLAAQSRLDEAENAYKKSIALSAANGLVFGNYGNLLARQSRFEEAETNYKRALELIPNNALLYNNYGNLLDGLGRLPEAEAIYKKAIEAKTDYPPPYYYIALLKARQNLTAEAIDWLGKALEKGYTNFDSISRNPAFDPLRETPEFKALLTKYRKN
ncbi:tetratricopeptide repeat protein [Runella slithyformis]|uniref:Tetratricopeptide TPR_2 repeat-containing protein n=1 Tax=Runella slithyformis (strain ATCC 29530 / DSM 19594 / LMG 11500 / NCIMB 11436 / LSU 4) TaxID=761193 RepID=A0A7U3ZGM0_RUNSL|nr:tetratricopeptide repeat protein [Runella slithyformis]AEI46853.1 Tetratricopeptide TPR_2 repeat-containing protein [Runella slithyformis DSM 19594]